MKVDLDDKTDVLTYHKKLLAEAEKEKEELKAKVKSWQTSSESLKILLNSQMSVKDKTGLGSSDLEDTPMNDRYAEGMQVVPPPMTGTFIPFGPDREIDESQFTYGPEQSKPSESDARSSDFNSCESNSSEETLESMPELVINEPKVVSQPKVWSDAPIIEEYGSDSDDNYVSTPSKEQEQPSFAFVNTDKHVKTLRETVKNQHTYSQSPKVDRRDYNGLMSQNLGTGQRENRPVWNNVQRVNHQNQFVPTAVLTRTGRIPINTARASSTNNVNTARHNFNSQAIPTNTVRKVNTVKPIMNEISPRNNFYKSYSSIRRPFNRTTAPNVNTAEGKAVTTQAAEIKSLKAQIKQLKKKAKPVIKHHKAWIKSVSMKTRLARKKSMKKKLMQKESVSKQGRKPAKSEPTVHKDPAFDDLDDILDNSMDYMETEDAHDEGRTSSKGVSTEDPVSTAQPTFGTDKPKVSTNKVDEGTVKPKDGNSEQSPNFTNVFKDDETIAQFLVTISQNKAKQKGVKIKDTEDTDRPRITTERSVLTLKPLPNIDPKDKSKKVLEEEAKSDAESEGVNEAKRKFAQLESDAEVARKLNEEMQAEAEINADAILAARMQEEESIKYTDEQKVKFLHDTIAAQRKILAEQRALAKRNKPPSIPQLRNQMMTYLKHVGGYKHAQLNKKKFEELQVLYEKVKRSDENFIAIGSVEDERIIKDLNKKAAGIKKDDSIEEESKEEEGTKKRKLGTRKKIKSRKRRFRQDTSEGDKTDSEKENDELRLCLTIAPDEDKEVDYEILDKKYPIIEWKTEYLGTKPQYDETKELEEINLNVVIRSNGQKRYFSTLMRVLSIFDREDLKAVYQLVMDRYQNEIPKGFDRVLWGDLMIMFNPIIHMLIENKYPLRKRVLLQMLELKMEFEEDSTMALELIRFVKKLIQELEPGNSDGDNEYL
ncbi:hypothetical protein Tco_0451362 [Tanacetum coccineum]